jgi:hypothetical protein
MWAARSEVDIFQSLQRQGRHKQSFESAERESDESFLTVLVKHCQEFIEVDWLGEIALESAVHRGANLLRQCISGECDQAYVRMALT